MLNQLQGVIEQLNESTIAQSLSNQMSDAGQRYQQREMEMNMLVSNMKRFFRMVRGFWTKMLLDVRLLGVKSNVQHHDVRLSGIKSNVEHHDVRLSEVGSNVEHHDVRVRANFGRRGY
jgi:hypothetical protein